jgi:hypothetical protein
VKVRCDEGVAIHIGPRAVRRHPRGPGEASAGERIGQPLSREKYLNPSADVLINTESNIERRDIASAGRLGVVEDPGMCRSSLHGNREVSGSTCGGTSQARTGETRSRSR